MEFCRKCGAPYITVYKNDMICSCCLQCADKKMISAVSKTDIAAAAKLVGEALSYYLSEQLDKEILYKALNCIQRARMQFKDDPSVIWLSLLIRFGVKALPDTANPSSFSWTLWHDEIPDGLIGSSLEFERIRKLCSDDEFSYFSDAALEIDSMIAKIRQSKQKCKTFFCVKTETCVGATEEVNLAVLTDQLMRDHQPKTDVFFAKRVLENKKEDDFEPMVWNALHSAKLMVIFVSRSDHMASTWIVSEWVRYLNRKMGKILIVLVGNAFAADALHDIMQGREKNCRVISCQADMNGAKLTYQNICKMLSLKE